MAGGREKSLSIIIPSYNDARILHAIDSVRAFDDVGQVSIVLIDGGSKPDLVARISERLTSDDILVSEPDRGIFDALNKGLAAVQTEYIGWIGSDDTLSGIIKAGEVIANLKSCDLFVADTAHVRGESIVRVTHSWSSRHPLLRLFINNPHFSTFGRSGLLKLEKFSLHLRGADIAYFLTIFDRKPIVRTSSKIAVFMEVGGFSNSSYKSSVKMHAELYDVHKNYIPKLLVSPALFIKFSYKFASTLYFKLFRTTKARALDLAMPSGNAS